MANQWCATYSGPLLVHVHCIASCTVCVPLYVCYCPGECSAEELERLMTIVANPRAYKIPDWFLNRQKDHKTGRFSQVRQGLNRG